MYFTMCRGAPKGGRIAEILGVTEAAVYERTLKEGRDERRGYIKEGRKEACLEGRKG
jgi:hypothetical protein